MTMAVPVWVLLLAGAAAGLGGLALWAARSRNSGQDLPLPETLRHPAPAEPELPAPPAPPETPVACTPDAESFFRRIYESSSVGIFRTTVDGDRVLLGNEAAAAMFGYASVAEFLDRCRPEQAYAEPGQRELLLETLHAHGHVDGFEILVARPDGSRKVLALAASLDAESGTVEGAVLDITARRRAERELQDSHLFLQTVMDTIPNPLFYKDGRGQFRHVNSAFEQFLGHGRREVLGRTPGDLVPPEVAADWMQRSEALLAGGAGVHRFDTWIRTRGGARRDVVVQEGLVADSAGKHLGLVGVITDVTDLKRIESDLREAWATYRNIFDNAVDGIFTTTAEGRFVRANAAMARILGYDSPDELVRGVTDLASQVYASPDKRMEVLGRMQEEGVLRGHEVEVLRRNGSRIWLSLSLRAIRDEDGALVRVEGVATDVSERRREVAELAQRALTDPLTGLPNRVAFEREFERMLAQARRSGQTVGVLFMDLDGFKPVNDTHGHQTGDELLRVLGERLRERLRVSDMASRIGGDEFGVLLWNVSGAQTMERIAHEIIDALNKPVDLEACRCEVGVSVGGSLFPAHGVSPRELISRADQAMYRVKQQGRNHFLLAGGEGDGDGCAPDAGCQALPARAGAQRTGAVAAGAAMAAGGAVHADSGPGEAEAPGGVPQTPASGAARVADFAEPWSLVPDADAPGAPVPDPTTQEHPGDESDDALGETEFGGFRLEPIE